MMQSQQDLSLPLIAKQPPSVPASSASKFTIATEIVLSIALPILIYTQFSIVLPQEESTLTLQGLTVDTVTFCLASIMYRSFLFQRGGDSLLVAHLLPELASLATIACVWYGQVFIGFLCMSCGTLLMSLAVAWHCASALLESPKRCVLGLLMNIGLPCLIVAQYHISFFSGNDRQGLTVAVVHCAVASFLLGTLMYRQVLDERKVESWVLHLIPEVAAVGTVLLAAHGDVVYGFYCLVLGECALALVVAAVCVDSLCGGGHESEQEDTDEEPMTFGV